MRFTITLNDDENKKLDELSQKFNLSKSQVAKNLMFKCNKIDKLKTKDYNLFYLKLLKLNNNITQFINFLNKNNDENILQYLHILHDLKRDFDELKKDLK